jgi:S1-C subfamily serine protease
MSEKAVYQLSGRQILLVAFASALLAVGTAACVSYFGGFGNNPNNVTFAEQTPTNLSDPSTVSDEQNNIEVYKSLSPGVAFITTSQKYENWFGQEFEQESGNGSGSVIDAEGHILTNYHVIEGSSKLTVSLGGDKVYPAKIVGGDPSTDLAVIKIDAPKEGLTVVPFGDSDKLIVGQKVLAIGNPFGLDRTLTTGVISGLQRPIRARNNRLIEGAIQTDASINPGNSGGPLLDKFGKMIGINSQILSPSGASSGVGFAVPISIAKRVVPQLIQFGEVRRPKLGISYREVSSLVEQGYTLPVEKGLLVINLQDGNSQFRTPTVDQRTGQVSGDILTAIDGEKIDSSDDLFRFLDKKQIGDTVTLSILRDGKTVSVPVKLVSGSSQVQPQRPTRNF